MRVCESVWNLFSARRAVDRRRQDGLDRGLCGVDKEEEEGSNRSCNIGLNVSVACDIGLNVSIACKIGLNLSVAREREPLRCWARLRPASPGWSRSTGHCNGAPAPLFCPTGEG